MSMSYPTSMEPLGSVAVFCGVMTILMVRAFARSAPAGSPSCHTAFPSASAVMCELDTAVSVQ